MFYACQSTVSMYYVFLKDHIRLKHSVRKIITPHIRMLDSDWLIAVIFFYKFRLCIVNLQNFTSFRCICINLFHGINLPTHINLPFSPSWASSRQNIWNMSTVNLTINQTFDFRCPIIISYLTREGAVLFKLYKSLPSINFKFLI